MPDQKTNSTTKALATLDETYFKNNARVGIEHISQDDLPTPILKIVNREVLRADGVTPIRNGRLYYPALDVEADSFICSFLTYTKEMQPKYKKPDETERVYIIMGALDSKTGFKPFKMYFRGGSIGIFKKLLGQVTAQNKPLFAFELELSTEKRIGQDNDTYYILVINNKGIRSDADKIITLESLAREYSSSLNPEEESPEPISPEPIPAELLEEPTLPTDPDQDVQPDDIPF